MPIYEYACGQCGRVSSFLVRNTADHRKPACPQCGSRRMARALSRFSAVGGRKTSPATRGDDLGAAGPDPGGGPDLAGLESMLSGVDENDPRSMGRALRAVAEQAGEPLDAEMDDVCRRLESGEDPEAIESAMGDAFDGGETGGPGGGGGDELYDG